MQYKSTLICYCRSSRCSEMSHLWCNCSSSPSGTDCHRMSADKRDRQACPGRSASTLWENSVREREIELGRHLAGTSLSGCCSDPEMPSSTSLHTAPRWTVWLICRVGPVLIDSCHYRSGLAVACCRRYRYQRKNHLRHAPVPALYCTGVSGRFIVYGRK